MTDFYDLIVKLRAVREFRPEPISNDNLGAILEAARWTGSSKNRQDWSFVVVTGERLQGLAEHGDRPGYAGRENDQANQQECHGEGAPRCAHEFDRVAATRS